MIHHNRVIFKHTMRALRNFLAPSGQSIVAFWTHSEIDVTFSQSVSISSMFLSKNDRLSWPENNTPFIHSSTSFSLHPNCKVPENFPSHHVIITIYIQWYLQLDTETVELKFIRYTFHSLEMTSEFVRKLLFSFLKILQQNKSSIHNDCAVLF